MVRLKQITSIQRWFLKDSSIKFLLVSTLLFIGCENPISSTSDCSECGGQIASTLPQINGIYQLYFDDSRVQSFTMLTWETNCGLHQKISWDTDYQYQIQTDWVSLVNPASMTDEDGIGKIIFGVWQDFKGYTITIYGGWTDDCGHHHHDSIRIQII